MPTLSLVMLAIVAVFALWVLGAYNRLVRHRNAVLKAFGALHEQLARRHRQVHDLVARATEVAAGDPHVRLQSIAATHEAARTAADYAKAAPIDAARVSGVDRAEVALSHRLGRFIASLTIAPACRDDEELRRMRQDIVRGAAQLEFVTQAFNQAALAYNRAAREAPTHLVAKLFGFGDSAVVSPAIAKLPAKRKKPRGDGALVVSVVPDVPAAPDDEPAASHDAASAAAASGGSAAHEDAVAPADNEAQHAGDRAAAS
jgi:LemA protein